MKYLTKKWANKCRLVEFVSNLKGYDVLPNEKMLLSKSKQEFKKQISWDKELLKVAKNTDLLDNLHQARINNNEKLLKILPINVLETIKNKNALSLGFVSNEDRCILTAYAQSLLKEIKLKSRKAQRLNQIAIDYLPKEIDFDPIVGELAIKEYVKGKDFFISIGDFTSKIENYSVKNRDKFIINKWEEYNPLSLWTSVYTVELQKCVDNLFEISLLFLDGDKYDNVRLWEMTYCGTNITI